MKCLACVEFGLKSPWGFGGGGKRMQKSCVHDHEKNNEHKTTMAKQEAPPSMVPMYIQVQNDLEKKNPKIITCMKVFFST